MVIAGYQPSNDDVQQWSALSRFLRVYRGIPVRGFGIGTVGTADTEGNHDDLGQYNPTRDYSKHFSEHDPPAAEAESISPLNYLSTCS
jgi:hypothetical protein